MTKMGDTGSGSLHASPAFLEKLSIQPVRNKTRQTETNVFQVKIEDLSGSFQFTSEVSHVERETPLSSPNA